jgi:hypothetical protein
MANKFKYEVVGYDNCGMKKVTRHRSMLYAMRSEQRLKKCYNDVRILNIDGSNMAFE